VNELQFAGLTSALMFWSTPGYFNSRLTRQHSARISELHECQYFKPDPLLFSSRISDELFFVVSLDSFPDFVLAAYLIEQFF